jgi:hypothetical protein
MNQLVDNNVKQFKGKVRIYYSTTSGTAHKYAILLD